ncbi:hypothetical protein OG474_00615 [Kribbella sp. NBC_01505]|uniref:hypothetical protein n=1 Tax=Kribbella sp. NBC_01505 TaxID=2903580 RepID=UPI003864F513
MEIEEDSNNVQLTSGQGVGRPPTSWTIAGLIKLIDDAIDSAGAQLARSEGLRFDWTDDESVVRPINGRRPARARDTERWRLEEQAGPEREIDLA